MSARAAPDRSFRRWTTSGTEPRSGQTKVRTIPPAVRARPGDQINPTTASTLFWIAGKSTSPFSATPKDVIPMHLITFSTVVLSPIELVVVILILSIVLLGCCNLRFVIEKRLSFVLERGRVKRAPVPGDVSTELATAPGETGSFGP